ncbi:MAG: 2-oxoacid:acceptor oxidoreductase family protein [Dethiobacteria bacterium]|jgi:2-oxoglutarate ferredoxin oxidoreductase subunit gamma|nr:2-oxoacid:ferredoxin oxidoreductase subunit gamma [Bacillota bacterium]
MAKEYQVRLSGFGGQGLVLAGIILGEAVALYENKYTIQTQSYGPEARGGASRSEVVIGEEEVDLLEVTSPDLLLALSQEACDKYIVDLKEDGIVIIDPDFVKNPPQKGQIYEVPITKIAQEKLGKTIVANMVALGAIAAITKIVSKEALQKAVVHRVPKGTEELNQKAIALGFEAAKNLV